MALTTVYPNGIAEINVPATQSIAISNYGGGIASIYYLIEDANRPDAWQLQQTLKNSGVVLGAFATGKKIKIESGRSTIVYDVGASPDTGIGNADTLGGELPSYYTDADNIDAGTLADARLSTNVPLLDATQSFDGVNTFANDVYILPDSAPGSIADGGASVVIEESGPTSWSQGLAIAIFNSVLYNSGRQTVFLGAANSVNKFYLSAGARITDNPEATLWATPVATSAEFFKGVGGQFIWYGDTSLTIGAAYTPTVRMTLNAAGNLTVTGSISAGNGATGTFTTADAKTVTVTNGIITSIV